MKKKIVISIIILIIIILLVMAFYLYRNYREKERIKNAIIHVTLVDNLNIEFNSKIKVSDLITCINGIIINDYIINTVNLGQQTISFKYINEEGIKIPYQFEINIVDNTPPVIWLSDTYSVNVGYNGDLVNSIMCGDNYDSDPIKGIIGDYDLNKIGSYPLIYKAMDSSGNVALKKFNLIVKKKSSSSYNVNKIPFSKIYQNYKADNTKIGLDVSRWQGTIDYQKVKDAGVEFVFIKIGGTNGLGGDYYQDPKFINNIEGFINVGIPVGVYFYSYANSKEKAIEDAKWVIKNLADYKISLPIAYDWENWSKFNQFKMSFYELTESAKAFIKTINDNGYEGILYSSKNYLERIWLKDDYPVWLAHYTNKTNYQGKYQYWQMTSSATISGISENTVDVDIMYLT